LYLDRLVNRPESRVNIGTVRVLADEAPNEVVARVNQGNSSP